VIRSIRAGPIRASGGTGFYLGVGPGEVSAERAPRKGVSVAGVLDGARPWQILDPLGRIMLVEVWFELKDGCSMCLPRITQPEPAQWALLAQLGWNLPQQPPPRVYAKDLMTENSDAAKTKG